MDPDTESLLRARDRLMDRDWRPQLTEELRAELDQRLTERDASPDEFFTWEQVKAHARQKP